MNNIIERLKASDIRITPQRVMVYQVLAAGKKHLTVEEIYERIKPKAPAISLATIYTILEAFKEKNLISEIRIKFDKSCFEARVDFHHHFYCQSCGKIFDIDITPCAVLEKKEVNGHSIESLQGYFYGICRDCKTGV
ncbi:MAG: Fur family transcriptional regulator [Candidatus Omnitrophica bacterium]|nr:Fur family transcriptional regulator [Candidatus Omnitrophota bacterium]MDD5430139.1 Fur family transcriptional regulator [Candidatus Omnitrophota bacterium]